MFVILESFSSAIESIRSNALRSFLTMLGIIIGVASIIAMVSIIQGLNQSIFQQLEGLGTNSIRVQAFTPLEKLLQGQQSKLTLKDLTVIRTKIEGIGSITPFLYGQGSVLGYGSQATTSLVMGTTYSYQNIQQSYVETGRFLSISDDQRRRRVCVIGEEVRKKLSLPDNPVGEYLSYAGEWIKVIGLLQARGSFVGQNLDDVVLLPFSTMNHLLSTQHNPNIVIQLTLTDFDTIDVTIKKIRRLLRRARKLTTEPDDFTIQTAEEIQDVVSNVTTQITTVMAGILGISLVVGGIGIMNIMLVSVTERTREIGIYKAIGAKRYHILLQFLFEAVFLSLLGGLIGLLLGYGIGYLVASTVDELPKAYVPFWAIALAFGFSASVGVLFGILPAAKAASLDPIDALRHE